MSGRISIREVKQPLTCGYQRTLLLARCAVIRELLACCVVSKNSVASTLLLLLLLLILLYSTQVINESNSNCSVSIM